MKASIGVAIQPGTKLMQLELNYIDDISEAIGSQLCEYKLWLHHDIHMKYGTFLTLHPDGAIERTTLRPDGSEETIRVR